jgi:hypothetical protein
MRAAACASQMRLADGLARIRDKLRLPCCEYLGKRSSSSWSRLPFPPRPGTLGTPPPPLPPESLLMRECHSPSPPCPCPCPQWPCLPWRRAAPSGPQIPPAPAAGCGGLTHIRRSGQGTMLSLGGRWSARGTSRVGRTARLVFRRSAQRQTQACRPVG